MASSPTPIDPLEGHQLWAESYDADVNPLLALERRVLRPHLDRLSGKRFIDIGCGTGRWLEVARDAGADLLGVDLTREMLARAVAKPGLAGRLLRADAMSLPITSDIADVTLSSFCISYVEDLAAMFVELGRVTKPGGRVIVSDMHPLAMRAGWKRTFRSGGRRYEMQLAARRDKHPLRIGADTGLTLSRVLEPRFGAAELPLFEKAGKAESFERVAAIPALFITVWDREPSR